MPQNNSTPSWIFLFSLLTSLTCNSLLVSSTPLRGEEPATPSSPKEPGSHSKGTSRIGRMIPNFVLSDAEGKSVALADFHNSPVVVVLFLGTECPIANKYIPYIKDLRTKYASSDASFLIVDPHSGDTPEKILQHQKAFDLDIPVLCDPRQEVAQMFGAERLAQAFVLDYRRVARYSGRIDDRIGYGTKKSTPTREDLAKAIEDVLGNRDVEIAETPVSGCLITYRSSESNPMVTYCKEVAPILQKRCQNCHHAGTAAPFELSRFEEAANWSAMIREVVLDRRMPPWHADSRFGKFGNCPTLSTDEVETIVSWIDAGCPQGNPADLPPPQEYVEGWQIDKPDYVFQIPEEVSVPATGVVRYKYFETKTDFKEDVWIEAAEARPGNRSVVHHIIVFYNEPNHQGDLDDGWVVAYAPGDSPLQLTGRKARRIPAGASLIWQLHYTPTGKPETDRSELALRIYRGEMPPEHNVKTRGLYNRRFSIPAGDPHYRIASSKVFRQETTILTFMPHMHLRGKSFEYKFIFPDGREEIALSVPQYDFNWQTSYQLEKPLKVPAGTRLECTAYFDNSPRNPANPDPSKIVRWGEQTWDEMMIGYMDYYDEVSDAEGKTAATESVVPQDSPVDRSKVSAIVK